MKDRRDYSRAYRQKNREKINEYKRRWRARPENQKKATQEHQRWLAKPGNRERVNARARERLRSDSNHQQRMAEKDRKRWITRSNDHNEKRRSARKDPSVQMRISLAKRKSAYGLTPEAFLKLLQSQGGVCAICARREPGGRGGWHVDHDHETGVVRGLLCHYCNLMLGMAKDQITVLEAAIKYLSRYR